MENNKKYSIHLVMRFVFLGLGVFFFVGCIIFLVNGYRVKSNQAFSNIIWVLLVSFGYTFLILSLISAVLCVNSFLYVNKFSSEDVTLDEQKDTDTAQEESKQD